MRGGAIAPLGLLGSFPSSTTDNQIRLSLPPAKRKMRPGLMGGYIREVEISRICPKELIGEMSYYHARIFGEVERTQLRPVYREFNRRFAGDILSAREVGTFRRPSVISDGPPHPAPTQGRPRYGLPGEDGLYIRTPLRLLLLGCAPSYPHGIHLPISPILAAHLPWALRCLIIFVAPT